MIAMQTFTSDFVMFFIDNNWAILPILQLYLKGSLACLGWYNFMMLPNIFDSLENMKVISLPYGPLSAHLFFICNTIDIIWHWKGELLNIIHHAFCLIGTFCAYITPGFGINIIAITVILETVAPIYQLLKIKKLSSFLIKKSNFLRLSAIFINLTVRIPFCCWLWNLLILQLHAHSKEKDPHNQVNVFVWHLCLLNCICCVLLDVFWSSTLACSVITKLPS